MHFQHRQMLKTLAGLRSSSVYFISTRPLNHLSYVCLKLMWITQLFFSGNRGQKNHFWLGYWVGITLLQLSIFCEACPVWVAPRWKPRLTRENFGKVVRRKACKNRHVHVADFICRKYPSRKAFLATFDFIRNGERLVDFTSYFSEREGSTICKIWWFWKSETFSRFLQSFSRFFANKLAKIAYRSAKNFPFYAKS